MTVISLGSGIKLLFQSCVHHILHICIMNAKNLLNTNVEHFVHHIVFNSIQRAIIHITRTIRTKGSTPKGLVRTFIRQTVCVLYAQLCVESEPMHCAVVVSYRSDRGVLTTKGLSQNGQAMRCTSI